jgi:tRNA(Ile)-lysidine synthase
VIINKEKFKALHTAIQRQLLRMAIEKLIGNLKDIESRHIEEVLDALKKPAGKIIHLPYGLVFIIEYDRYLLGTNPFSLSPFPPFEGDYSLKVPGKTNIGKWDVEIKILKREDIKKGNRFTAYFDFCKTGDKLFVRTLNNGDRFQPLGMKRQKKLGKFMIDSRIPHAWRNRIPIVFSQEQMIWVVGFRMDERVKITQQTDKILKIRYKRLK